MRSIVLSGLLLVAAVGCATVRNTPAQDLAWERWQTCDHFAMITLYRVELDGRLVVLGYEHEAAPFNACIQQAAADQSRRGAAVGPQPLVLVKNYECMSGAM